MLFFFFFCYEKIRKNKIQERVEEQDVFEKRSKELSVQSI